MLTTAVVVVLAVLVAVALVGIALVGIACVAVGGHKERVPSYVEMSFGPEGVSLICSRCMAVSGPFPLSTELTASDMPCNCSSTPRRLSRKHAA